MPTSSQWLAFVVASLLFIQVPGPSLLFMLGRALTVSRVEALLSVVGNALGLLLQVLLVAAGLGAVVAASATAYTVLKLAGAAYVIYLGVQAIRHRGDARAAMEVQASLDRQAAAEGRTAGTPTGWAGRAMALRSVRTGFVVGVTNPKTIVFFVAFLPQFANEAAGHAGLQVALLGLVFSVLAVVSDSIWVFVASRARDWFARKPTRLDGLTATGGAMMIGLGATMVTTKG